MSGTLFPQPASGAMPFPSRTAGQERIERQERALKLKQIVEEIKTEFVSLKKHRDAVAQRLALVWTGKLYHDTHPSNFRAWFEEQGFDFTYKTAHQMLEKQGVIVHRKGGSNKPKVNSTPEWHRKISWFLNYHSRVAKERPHPIAEKVRLAVLALEEALKAWEKA